MIAWLLGNTIVAGCAALVVALVCRWKKDQPELCHGLWLLVFALLVMPPLPIDGHPGALLRARFESALPAPSSPLEAPAIAADSSLSTPAPLASMQLRPVPTSLRVREGEPPAPIVTPEPSTPELTLANLRAAEHPAMRPVLLGAGGVSLLALLAGYLYAARLGAFHRRVKRAPKAPDVDPELQAAVERVATRLGMRAPEVRLVPGIGSPAVWCLGRARLLWPLHDRESGRPRSLAHKPSVIAHELAHIARRDTWIARLEPVALLAFFWHPLFWLVRHRVHTYSEMACDAWALWAYPDDRRAYAEALVDSHDHNRTAPIAVRGLCATHPNVKDLERRLTLIMKQQVQRGKSRLLLTTATAIGLTVAPGLSQDKKEVVIETQPTKNEVVVRTAGDKAITVDATTHKVSHDGPTPKTVASGVWLDAKSGAKIKIVKADGSVQVFENADGGDSRWVFIDDEGELAAVNPFTDVELESLFTHEAFGEAEFAFEHDPFLNGELAFADESPFGNASFEAKAFQWETGDGRVVVVGDGGQTVTIGEHGEYVLTGGQGGELAIVDGDKFWFGDKADASTAKREYALAQATEAAAKAFRENDLDLALAKYTEMIELNPKDGFPHAQSAYILIGQGEYQKARKHLAAQLAKGDRPHIAHYNYACIESLEGNLDHAFISLTEALRYGFADEELMAKDGDLDNLRGDARFDAAMRLVEMYNENFEKSFVASGQELIAALEVASQIASNDGHLFDRLGMAYHGEGLYDMALANWQRQVELGASVPRGTYNIACALALLGDNEAAMDKLLESGELGFTYPAAKDDSDLESLKDDPRYTQAIEALSVRKNFVGSLEGLIAEGKLEAASAELEGLLATDDIDSEARGWANMVDGDIKRTLGAYEEARMAYERALGEAYERDKVALELAAVLEDLGRTVEAREQRAVAEMYAREKAAKASSWLAGDGMPDEAWLSDVNEAAWLEDITALEAELAHEPHEHHEAHEAHEPRLDDVTEAALLELELQELLHELESTQLELVERKLDDDKLTSVNERVKARDRAERSSQDLQRAKQAVERAQIEAQLAEIAARQAQLDAERAELEAKAMALKEQAAKKQPQ